jgi:nanoRNase/pAp phosphatase (c-di-AMP/oligoRNAs hydrolase)
MSETAMDSFDAFFRKYDKARIAFVAHSRADIDSIASAYVLKKRFRNSILLVPHDMTYSAGKLIEQFGIKFETLDTIDVKGLEGVVSVDASNYGLFELDKSIKVVAVFDHHQKAYNGFTGEFNFIDPNAKSTAEIVADILEKELDKEDAAMLAAAIIMDTARFKSANSSTFGILFKLVEKSKKDYTELLSLAYPPLPSDEKIAILKAMQRVEFFEHKGFVIAISKVNAKIGESASLISDAADAAFVAQYDETEKKTLMSARANQHFPVPLNAVMEEIGKKYGGSGGGHFKAAGAFARARPEEVLDYCVELLMREIDKKGLDYSQIVPKN